VLFLKWFNFHSSYNKHPCAVKARVSNVRCWTLWDSTLSNIQLVISILHVTALCYNRAMAAVTIMCRSRNFLSIFAVREYKLSSWRTHNLKTLAVGLHLRRQVHRSLPFTSEKILGNFRWIIFGSPWRLIPICLEM
jgi:hypothetical protein